MSKKKRPYLGCPGIVTDNGPLVKRRGTDKIETDPTLLHEMERQTAMTLPLRASGSWNGPQSKIDRTGKSIAASKPEPRGLFKCMKKGCNKRTDGLHCAEHQELDKDYQPSHGKPVSPSTKGCFHYGDAEVVCSRGVSLRGAQGALLKSEKFDPAVLVINCTTKPCVPPTIWRRPIALAGLVDDSAPQELMLDIPDYGVPGFTAEFWFNLAARIVAAGITQVKVCCQGGHGRTGTVLACLMIALEDSKFLTATEVVEKIRAKHCKHAVESQKQVDYICDVADHAMHRTAQGSAA